MLELLKFQLLLTMLASVSLRCVGGIEALFILLYVVRAFTLKTQLLPEMHFFFFFFLLLKIKCWIFAHCCRRHRHPLFLLLFMNNFWIFLFKYKFNMSDTEFFDFCN